VQDEVRARAGPHGVLEGGQERDGLVEEDRQAGDLPVGPGAGGAGQDGRQDDRLGARGGDPRRVGRVDGVADVVAAGRELADQRQGRLDVARRGDADDQDGRHGLPLVDAGRTGGARWARRGGDLRGG
jgi:hypothetical protein